MATIAELAQMINNVHNGTPSASQNTGQFGPLLDVTAAGAAGSTA